MKKRYKMKNENKKKVRMDRLRIFMLIWLVSSGDHGLKEVKTVGEGSKREYRYKQETNQDIMLTGNRMQGGETTGLYKDGMWTYCFQKAGQMKCMKLETLHISGKEWNKIMKIKNGNGTMRQNILAIHWNMGARKWTNKRAEIEAVIEQFTPDIFLISEANMSTNLTDAEKDIGGYSMVLPRTVEVRQLVRLVMLVREGVRVEEMRNLMDSEIASIWVRVGPKGRKQLLIGGIYREHQFLEQGEDKSSETDIAQEGRWKKFVDKWEQAGRNTDVMVLGDTNLDHLTWALPKQKT